MGIIIQDENMILKDAILTENYYNGLAIYDKTRNNIKLSNAEKRELKRHNTWILNLLKEYYTLKIKINEKIFDGEWSEVDTANNVVIIKWNNQLNGFCIDNNICSKYPEALLIIKSIYE